MSEYELKKIEVLTQVNTVLVASDLDDPQQAISNAEKLWPKGQLTSGTTPVSTFTNFMAYISSEEDPTEPEIAFPEQLKILVPLNAGSLYQVRMEREYRRIEGETRWKLYSVDITNPVKVGD